MGKLYLLYFTLQRNRHRAVAMWQSRLLLHPQHMQSSPVPLQHPQSSWRLRNRLDSPCDSSCRVVALSHQLAIQHSAYRHDRSASLVFQHALLIRDQPCEYCGVHRWQGFSDLDEGRAPSSSRQRTRRIQMRSSFCRTTEYFLLGSPSRSSSISTRALRSHHHTRRLSQHS